MDDAALTNKKRYIRESVGSLIPTDMGKSKNSSNSSKGFGNTKQIPPSKHWCFTLNNYTVDEIQEIKEINSSIVPRYVFQEEKGENGTEHLQGYVQFKSKVRPKGIFKNKKIHWEKCRNVKASIAYCQKEDTRNGKVWYRGIEKPYSIKIRHWQPWMYKVKGIIEAEPDERKIHWVWEPNGNRGKTVFSKWCYLNYDRILMLSGKAADMKHAIAMYVQKNNMHPRTILVNIPRSRAEYISYTGLEEIKDMFFFSGKYEGGHICGPNPHVIVMANSEPEREKMSDDRWEIINI